MCVCAHREIEQTWRWGCEHGCGRLANIRARVSPWRWMCARPHAQHARTHQHTPGLRSSGHAGGISTRVHAAPAPPPTALVGPSTPAHRSGLVPLYLQKTQTFMRERTQYERAHAALACTCQRITRERTHAHEDTYVYTPTHAQRTRMHRSAAFPFLSRSAGPSTRKTRH